MPRTAERASASGAANAIDPDARPALPLVVVGGGERQVQCDRQDRSPARRRTRSGATTSPPPAGGRTAAAGRTRRSPEPPATGRGSGGTGSRRWPCRTAGSRPRRTRWRCSPAGARCVSSWSRVAMPSAATRAMPTKPSIDMSVRSAPPPSMAVSGPQRTRRAKPAKIVAPNPTSGPADRARTPTPCRRAGSGRTPTSRAAARPTMLAGPPAAPSGPICERRRDHEQDRRCTTPDEPGRVEPSPLGERRSAAAPSRRAPPGRWR